MGIAFHVITLFSHLVKLIYLYVWINPLTGCFTHKLHEDSGRAFSLKISAQLIQCNRQYILETYWVRMAIFNKTIYKPTGLFPHPLIVSSS